MRHANAVESYFFSIYIVLDCSVMVHYSYFDQLRYSTRRMSKRVSGVNVQYQFILRKNVKFNDIFISCFPCIDDFAL